MRPGPDDEVKTRHGFHSAFPGRWVPGFFSPSTCFEAAGPDCNPCLPPGRKAGVYSSAGSPSRKCR
jgi:hypothetical protein